MKRRGVSIGLDVHKATMASGRGSKAPRKLDSSPTLAGTPMPATVLGARVRLVGAVQEVGWGAPRPAMRNGVAWPSAIRPGIAHRQAGVSHGGPSYANAGVGVRRRGPSIDPALGSTVRPSFPDHRIHFRIEMSLCCNR